MKRFVTAIAIAALFSTASMAVASPKSAKDPIATVHGKIICPVTGNVIASPKEAYNSEVYQGKTYYFCCEGCKPMFDKNPQKYIKAMNSSTAKHPSKSM